MIFRVPSPFVSQHGSTPKNDSPQGRDWCVDPITDTRLGIRIFSKNTFPTGDLWSNKRQITNFRDVVLYR